MKNKPLWVVLAMQVMLAAVVYGMVLLLNVVGLSETTRPVIPDIRCGSDRISVRTTIQFHWSNRLNSLQVYWNDRLVDLKGEIMTQPGKLLLLRSTTGSELDFYPAFVKPHQWQQMTIGPTYVTTPDFTIWVNPAQFSKTEFIQMAECFRAHNSIIASALRAADPSKKLISAQRGEVAAAGVLIYANVQQFIHQKQAFSNPRPNARGDRDQVVIRANGEVDFIRRDDPPGYRRRIGRLIPGTDCLHLRLNGDSSAKPSPTFLPNLVDVSRYKNEEGQTLGSLFKIIEQSF